MTSKLSPQRLSLVRMVGFCFAASILMLRFAAAQPPPTPSVQPQPVTQPAQSPADTGPKFTPEQQQQLDRANELLTQVSKLNDQGKYRDAIPLGIEALKLRESVLPADNPKIAAACSGSVYCIGMRVIMGKQSRSIARRAQSTKKRREKKILSTPAASTALPCFTRLWEISRKRNRSINRPLRSAKKSWGKESRVCHQP